MLALIFVLALVSVGFSFLDLAQGHWLMAAVSLAAGIVLAWGWVRVRRGRINAYTPDASDKPDGR